MKVGHVSGQRQQPRDRNISLGGGYWGSTDLAPHELTTRVSYTVPTGRKAEVTCSMNHVVRMTAAGTLGTAGSYNSDPTTIITYCSIYDNTPGVTDKMVINKCVVRLAGDTISALSWDDSTGGTCLHMMGFEVMEYDA